MHIGLLDSIKIKPNRQRQEFDPAALEELIDSIETSQLLHPIVCRIEDGILWLVAGERRLRAITEMHALGRVVKCNNEVVNPGYIPFSLLGELSELEAAEAEWAENVRRKDLTWQERAAATEQLKTLFEKRHGRTPTTTELVTEQSAAKPTGRALVTRRQELLICPHLDDPDVAKAKTLPDAIKIVERKQRDARSVAIAQKWKGESKLPHNILLCNSLEWMRNSSAQFDVICTDPIYGMDAHRFGLSGGASHAGGAHPYDDSYEAWLEMLEVFGPESFRLAKPQAHLYAFCDIERFVEFREWMNEAGWEVFRTPLIWVKPVAYRAPWPDRGPQRRYEAILFAAKGAKPVTKMVGDVLVYPPDESVGHQAQKPVALITDLLSRSVAPGNSILDPFCGSGAVIPAGHSLACVVTAIDKEEASVGMAIKRLEDLK